MGKQAIPVLNGVTLDIFKNEYVALMGLRIGKKHFDEYPWLPRLLQGNYILNDQDVSKMSDGELADVRNKKLVSCFSNSIYFPSYQPKMCSSPVVCRSPKNCVMRWRKMYWIKLGWLTEAITS